jgi:hypothetical protein
MPSNAGKKELGAGEGIRTLGLQFGNRPNDSSNLSENQAPTPTPVDACTSSRTANPESPHSETQADALPKSQAAESPAGRSESNARPLADPADKGKVEMLAALLGGVAGFSGMP